MQETAQVAGAQQSGRDVAVSQEVYSRDMPGGGRVLVELLVSDRGDVAGERSRGRVVVDGARGLAARGGSIVVVEELEDADSSAVVDKLFQIARDNVAIARRLIRRSAGA